MARKVARREEKWRGEGRGGAAEGKSGGQGVELSGVGGDVAVRACNGGAAREGDLDLRFWDWNWKKVGGGFGGGGGGGGGWGVGGGKKRPQTDPKAPPF